MSRLTDTESTSGGTMQVDTGAFQALKAEVAELAARLERYHEDACIIRAIEDAIGHPMTTASRYPRQRARHLQAVRDDGS